MSTCTSLPSNNDTSWSTCTNLHIPTKLPHTLTARRPGLGQFYQPQHPQSCRPLLLPNGREEGRDQLDVQIVCVVPDGKMRGEGRVRCDGECECDEMMIYMTGRKKAGREEEEREE